MRHLSGLFRRLNCPHPAPHPRRPGNRMADPFRLRRARGRQSRRPAWQNAEGHHLAVTALSGKMSGGVLLSHAVSHAVPSALKGLTSGFGMGPGVSPSLWPPKHYGNVIPGAATHSEPTARRDRPHLGNRTVDAKQYQSVVAKPLGLLVPVSAARCRASTSGLSTQSSSWGPYQVNPEGDLILRRASRLDAFSGYPFQT